MHDVINIESGIADYVIALVLNFAISSVGSGRGELPMYKGIAHRVGTEGYLGHTEIPCSACQTGDARSEGYRAWGHGQVAEHAGSRAVAHLVL
jgi:hypothetical protein